MKTFTMRISIAIIFIVSMQTVYGKRKIVSESAWKTSENFPEEMAGIYNKSDIKWWLMNDADNLYIKLETTNRDAQGALMMNGLTFYFDTVKQKSHTTSLIYTNRKEPRVQTNTRQEQRDINPSNAMFSPQRRENLSRNYNKAISNEMPYDLEMEMTDFSASFMLDTNNVLTCYAVIPLKLIHSGGLPRIHHLSIGIEISGKDSSDENAGDRQGPPPSRISGSKGGGEYGSRNGRPEGDEIPEQASEEKPSTLITFWFLTNLALPQD